MLKFLGMALFSSQYNFIFPRKFKENIDEISKNFLIISTKTLKFSMKIHGNFDCKVVHLSIENSWKIRGNFTHFSCFLLSKRSTPRSVSVTFFFVSRLPISSSDIVGMSGGFWSSSGLNKLAGSPIQLSEIIIRCNYPMYISE